MYTYTNSILNKHELQIKIDQLFKMKMTLESRFTSELDYLNSQISDTESKASVTVLRKSEQLIDTII